jgi:hypothetical protein
VASGLPEVPEPDLGSIRLHNGKEQQLGHSDDAMKAFGFQCYARGVMAGKAQSVADAQDEPPELDRTRNGGGNGVKVGTRTLTDEQISELWSWSMTPDAEKTATTQQHAFARAIESAITNRDPKG